MNNARIIAELLQDEGNLAGRLENCEYTGGNRDGVNDHDLGGADRRQSRDCLVWGCKSEQAEFANNCSLRPADTSSACCKPFRPPPQSLPLIQYTLDFRHMVPLA